jgi:glycosyltransferase involved in cell wall biosynthesis
MKIIKLVNDLGLAGTQRCAQNYAIALKESGLDVAVLAYAELGPRADVLEKLGIPVELIKEEDGVGIIQSYEPDVIHIHREGHFDQTTTRILSEIRVRMPHVAIVETNVFSRADFKMPSGVIDLHLQLSDWCLVKFNLWARGAKGACRSAVLPYLVDYERFHRVSDQEICKFRSKYGIDERSFVFGRIGSPIDAKWDTIIIDAFERLDNSNAYLVLVSAPAPIKKRLEDLPPSIKKRVIEIPFLNTDQLLSEAFSSMDVFLHASQIGESFGMVLAESLLCETPILALSTPLKDNTQELLVPDCGGGEVAATLDEMVHYMNDAIQNQGKWRQKGVVGSGRVKELFGRDAILPKLLELYQMACAIRSGNLSGNTDDEHNNHARKKVNECLKRYPLKTRVAFFFLHVPVVYKGYRSLKSYLRG